MSDISTFAGINTYNTATTSTSKTGSFTATGSLNSQAMTQSLTITDFYQLLATQLQYQDADNPMDTAEMMSQLVQTQMSQSISLMTTAINDLATVNMFSYASSMMGQEVTVAVVDDKGNYTGEKITGIVTGVKLGSVPSICIDGKEYSIMQIMSIGDSPSSSENSDDTQSTENIEGTQTV